MSRFRAVVTTSLLVIAILVDAAVARAQTKVASPGTTGDQLLFFYDATEGRTPFLVVSNLSPAEITLDIAWYPQDVGRRLATQREILAPGGNVVLDPSQVQGVNGNAGITVVTPVVDGSRPVVPQPLNDSLASAPSGPLAGGFTLADLSTGSAFGQNPLARVAVTADGKRAAAGAIVDGTTVRYQRIAPDALTIPFYFNPTTAGFSNRAILGAFEDRYGAGAFDIGPSSADLQVTLIDAAGSDVAQSSITVSGVAFNTIQQLADAVPVTGSGKVLLGVTSPLAANANLLGLMSQAIGTFGVGQGLPGYFAKQERFVDNGDGTITDRSTGLQWEKKTAGSAGDPHDVDATFEWSSSDTTPGGSVFTSFLVALNGGPTGVGNCVLSGGVQTGGFANHCDWRLPTLAELRTIVDPSRVGCGGGETPCIDPIFGPTSIGLYWTALTAAGGAEFAFTVSFLDGTEPTVVKTSGRSVRAVRGGS